LQINSPFSCCSSSALAALSSNTRRPLLPGCPRLIPGGITVLPLRRQPMQQSLVAEKNVVKRALENVPVIGEGGLLPCGGRDSVNYDQL